MKAAKKLGEAMALERKKILEKNRKKAEKQKMLKEEEDRKIKIRCAKPTYSKKQAKKMD